MSDSEAERQRKLQAGREKLLQYQQKKRKKKKEEASKRSQKSNGDVQTSKKSGADQDTDHDVSSIASSVGRVSNPGSPTPVEGDQQSYVSGSENQSYASGSDYTSGDESFLSSAEDGDGGLDSLAIAHLENNELRQRVLELEEILRGKVAAMKELNKENFELKSKIVASKSAERQSATASPILHNEIEELQQTLYNKQKALDEIHKENQDLRVKLSSTGSNSKSESSQIEELRGKLTSKQNTLEMLSQQNEQLVEENKGLKEKSLDLSFGSDSAQIESMQENLKTKQMILSELNKQNQELREKLTGARRELDVKEDEIERLKANEVTLVQTRELLRETSAELRTAQSEISRLKETIDQQQGALIQELVERDNKIAQLQNMYNALSSGRGEHSLKVETLVKHADALSAELTQKDTKVKELEDQLSLAIGERDAVQLEANTQIEDFEEQIKILQEQLRKNDSVTKERDQFVDQASEEVVKGKDAVMELQSSMEMKENEVKNLLNQLEIAQQSKNSELEEVRNILSDEVNDLREEIESKEAEMKDLTSRLNIAQEDYQNSKTSLEEKISSLESLLQRKESEFAEEYEKLEENYQSMLRDQEGQYQLRLETEREKWETEMSGKLQKVRAEQNQELNEVREQLSSEFSCEKDEQKRQVSAQEQIYQAQIDNLQNEVGIARKEVKELSETLNEKHKEIVELNDKLVDRNNEIRQVNNNIADKDDQIRNLSVIINEKDGELESVVDKIDNQDKEINELSEIINEKDNELDLVVSKLDHQGKELEQARREIRDLGASYEKDRQDLTEKHSADLNGFETQKMNLTNLLDQERANIDELLRENEALKAEKLSEENTAVSQLTIEKDFLRREVENLRKGMTQKDSEAQKLRQDLFSKCNEMENLRKEREQFEIQKSQEFSNMKNALVADKIKALESLQAILEEDKKNALIDFETLKHEIDTYEQIVTEKDIELEHAFQERDELELKIKELEQQKETLVQEHEEKISGLQEGISQFYDQHKLVADNLYSENIAQMQAEHLEQVQNLKEELAHIKEMKEKQLDKLQADYEAENRQLDEENRHLKSRLEEMQQKYDMGLSAIDGTAQNDIQNLQELHETKISKLKDDFAQQLNIEKEKLKEEFDNKLKKIEEEREKEIKLAVESAEHAKNLAIENIKTEKAKLQEVSDVVCSLTEERRQNVEQIKEELEKQLNFVRTERDQELADIQEQYRNEKERKIAEVEELLANQMAKYQTELLLLQNKLAEAEDKVYNLCTEKEDLSMKLMESRAFVEKSESKRKELEDKLTVVQKNSSSLEEELLKLQDINEKFKNKISEGDTVKQDLQEHIGRLTDDNEKLQQYLTDMKHKDTENSNEALARIKKHREILGDSFREVLHELTPQSESLLEQSLNSFDDDFSFENYLKELTAISKQQILELLQKMKDISENSVNVEKHCNEVSCLNTLLNEEVKRLDDELNSTKQLHTQVNEERVNLQGMVNTLQFEMGVLQTEKNKLETSLNKEKKETDSFLNKDRHDIDAEASDRITKLSSELEQLRKDKSELEDSLVKVTKEKEALETVRSGQGDVQIPIIILEDVDAEPVSREEPIIVPESIEEVAMEQQDFSAFETEASSNEEEIRELKTQIKHLESLLVESSKNEEKLKGDNRYLKEELENERQLFAEQLELRQAKERELTESRDEFIKQKSAADQKDYQNNIEILIEKLENKERKENDLREENRRLVSLLKENNLELYREKESLQEQIVKQEEVIQELHSKMSTSDLVTNEIQDAFGRQLAALHQQRNSLMKQLEQHKQEHQGYAKVVQEKADLEENLRNEKQILAEKLRQKEMLEKELDAEKTTLREKLAELDKLRGRLCEKEKHEEELIEERNSLQLEFERIENQLKVKEVALSIGREELQKELEMKDLELENLEKEINERVQEFGLREEKMKQHFVDTLESAREDFERTNEENLSRLRNDLDEDYRTRLGMLENGLHEEYGQQLTRMRENYEDQTTRMKTEFEERLRELRRQLEEERLRQVGTIRNVLEREHRQELLDMQTGHDMDIEAIRSGLKEKYDKELDEFRLSLENSYQESLERLKASLQAESQAKLGEEKLRAHNEHENSVDQLKEEFALKLRDELTKMRQQYEGEIQQARDSYAQDAEKKIEENIIKLKKEHSEEMTNLSEDSSNKFQLRIRDLEKQLEEKHHEQLKQAQEELHGKYRTEIDALKSELREKHGEEMHKAMSEFQTEQETYFNERLHQLETEHQLEVERLRQEYEMVLTNSKQECDELKVAKFKEKQDLSNQIKSNELEINRLEEIYKTALAKKEEDFKKRMEVVKGSIEKEKELWKFENQEDIQEVVRKFERTLMQKECELEERVQELRSKYETEILKKDMDHIKEIEDVKLELEKREAELEHKRWEELSKVEQNAASDLEELKAKHKEELEKAVSLLASNLKEDFDRIIAQVKRQHEQEKEEIRRTSGLDKEKELEMLRVELKSDYDKELERIKEEFDSSKTNALASLNTTLALKQAQENEKLRRKLTRKYEKEMDAIRSEMQDDFSRNALRQAEQLEMMEMNHKNELSKLKKEMEDKHQKLSDQLGESKSEKGQGFREAVVEEPIPTISLEKVEMMEELSQPKLPIPLVDTFAESQADSILGAAMSDMSMGEATLMEQSSFGTGMFRDSDFNLVGQTPSGLRKDPSSLLFADDKGNRASLGTDEERTPSQERMLEKIEKRLRHHELEAKMSREKLKEDLDKEYGMKIEKMTKEKEFEMEKAMEKLKMELDERYSQLLQERIQEKEAELKNLVSDLEEDHKNNLRKILTEKDEEFEKLKAIIDEKYRTELDDRIKEKESEAVTDHLALMEHHQKLIDEFVTEQEKQLTELKQEHEQELDNLKLSLQSEYGERVSELEHNQENALQLAMENYESKMRLEREGNDKQRDQDMEKFKEVMGQDNIEKHNTTIEILKEQHRRDLKLLQGELDSRRNDEIENLKRKQKVDVENAKDLVRSEMMDNMSIETERIREITRNKCEQEHFENLRQLEEELEQKHIKQLESLAEMQQKHVRDIEAMKQKNENEKAKLTKELSKKFKEQQDKHAEEIDAVNLDLEKEIEKIKMELEAAHKRELQLQTVELSDAKSKILSLEALNAGMDSTYQETIGKLQEDYENEIYKLKQTLEEVRKTQVEQLERTFRERQEAESQIALENFEKELAKLRQQHEELINDIKKECEEEKQTSLGEMKAQHDKKLIELEERFGKEKTEMELRMNDIRHRTGKESNWFKDENERLALQLKEVNGIYKQLEDDNVSLKSRIQQLDDQLATVISRHEREEQESDNLIKMLRSDIARIAQERNDLRRSNDHLLRVLSDSVRAAMLTEDMINKHLDELILENSKTESGAGIEPSLSELATSIRKPEGTRQARVGSEETPTGGLPLPFPRRGAAADNGDTPEQTQVKSEGSLLSDEGLELSHIHSESMFQGPELDGDSEDIVKGASERLRTAVEHLLKMLSVTTRQAADTKRSFEDFVENTSYRDAQAQDVLSSNEELVQKIEKEQQLREHLQEADKNLRHEQEHREDLEKELTSKEHTVESIRKETENLRLQLQNLTNKEKLSDSSVKDLEEKCTGLQTEKNLLAKVKLELEMRLAELRTSIEKERYALKYENDQLKVQVAKKANISMDDLEHAFAEIEELKNVIQTLSEEKELLRSQITRFQDNSVAGEKEIESLKEHLSQVMNEHRQKAEENELLKGKYDALVAAVEESSEQHREELKDLLVSIEKLRQENDDLKEQQERKEQEITEAKEQELIEALKYAKEQYNGLHGELSHLQGVIENLNEQVREGNESIRDQEQKKLELTKAYESEKEKNTALQRELKNLEDVVETLKQNTDHISMELEDKAETELELLNRISEMEGSFSALQAVDQSKVDLEQQVKHLVKDKNEVLEKLKRSQSEFQKLKEDLKGKEKELTTLQANLDETRALISDSKILKLEVDKLRETLSSKDDQYSGLAREAELVRELLDAKVQELEQLVNEQQDEINTLNQLMETKNTELVRKEQGHQEHLNRLQSGLEHQLEEAVQMTHDKLTEQYRLQIAQLEARHKAEVERLLEVSQLDTGDLGHQLEEALGATERLDRQMIEHLIRQSQMNESKASINSLPRDNSTVQTLLTDLQSEAERIANLVVSYPIVDHGLSLSSLKDLQRSWASEKQGLLQTVKALKELVVKASQTAVLDTSRTEEDWRDNLIRAVHEVFDKEREVLRAEIETLQQLVDSRQASPALLHDAKRQVRQQEESMNRAVESLQSRDRESLIMQIIHLQNTLEGFQQQLKNQEEEYKRIVKDNHTKFEKRESHLDRQLVSQTNLAEQERTAASQLRTQLEEETNRNAELKNVLENEKKMLDDLKETIHMDQEKINDLVTALENEQKELKNIRARLEEERAKSDSLQRQASEQERRNAALSEGLDNERKRVQEQIAERKRLLEVAEADKLTISQLLNGRDELNQQLSRLSDALQKEETERMKLENIAERYQTNLEELRKLYLSEKEQRIETDRLLAEQKQGRTEELEKGQRDTMEKESLKKELEIAKREKSEVQHELQRAQIRLTSYEAELKSEMTMRSAAAADESKIHNLSQALAEERKNVEKLKETIENTRRNASEDVQREKVTCRQLREALNNLQLKYENARRQLEIARQQNAETKVSHGHLDEREKALQAQETALKQKEEEVQKRESELIKPQKSSASDSIPVKVLESFGQRQQKLVLQHQDLMARERQNVRFGSPTPVVNQVQDLQFIQGALADLLQDLKELQKSIEEGSRVTNLSSAASPVFKNVLKKNDELRDRLHKLNDEKSELRATMTALEEQVMQYRKREAELEEAAKTAKSQMEGILAAEKSKWADERASMIKALESAMEESSKQRIEIANKELRDLDPSFKQLAEAGWSLPKVQKLYGKYLRAESFKKALIYQKKYLLFLVGGFQDTEALTLSMIAKLGSGPDRFQPEYRMSPALMRFRAGARVIIALWRMKYLVKKWSKGVMRVGEKHHRSKRESTRKSPMNSTENSPVQNSINAKILSTDGNHRNVPGQFVASAARSNRPTGNNENSYRERSKDTLSERNRLSVQNLSKGHSSNSESSSTDHDINQNYVKSKTEPKIYKDLLGDDNQIGRPTINGHSKPAMSGHDRHALNSHEYRPQSTGNYPLKRRVEKLGTDVNQRLSGRPDYSVNSHKDQSPPRAYPRPLSPKVDRASLAGRDIDRHSRQHGRSPSPSQHSSGRRSNSPLRNRSLSPVNQTASPSSGLDEANSSLNAYIRKLESLQARLRNSERVTQELNNAYEPMTEQIEETGDTRGNRIVGEMMQLIAENQNISVTHSVKIPTQQQEVQDTFNNVHL